MAAEADDRAPPLPPAAQPIVGVLLAAGRGRRFDATGTQSKLLQALPSGRTVAETAALNLRAGLDRVIAVVRPGEPPLADLLAACGCQVITHRQADRGMGSSIACAVQASTDAGGWVIALADMPAVTPTTIEKVAAALRAGATAAVPLHQGRRGHPVGFAARWREALAALDGDLGARALLAQARPLSIEVDDAGCLLDLDTPADFAALAAPAATRR